MPDIGLISVAWLASVETDMEHVVIEVEREPEKWCRVQPQRNSGFTLDFNVRSCYTRRHRYEQLPIPWSLRYIPINMLFHRYPCAEISESRVYLADSGE